MNQFNLCLGGVWSRVTADYFRQDGAYISFYVDGKVAALIRLGDSDSVVELVTSAKKSTVTPTEKCPDCGYLPGERGADLKQTV